MNTRKKGAIGEKKAVEYLISAGYKIIDTNVYTKLGEIDIIAKKDDVYHFIEVKSGKSFEPIYNITPKKLKRVINSAMLYMKQKGINPVFCIDAIVVKDEVDHFVNITF